MWPDSNGSAAISLAQVLSCNDAFPRPVRDVSTAMAAEPSADAVDQPHASIWKLLNLPQFKPATTLCGRKQRPALTGDQRIDNKPKFIHQSGIQQAGGNSAPPMR